MKSQNLTTKAALLAVSVLLTAGLAGAQTIAYDTSVQPGNQAYPANLGNDFDVLKPIVVESLGRFDSNAPAIVPGSGIQVGIFNRDTGLQVGPTATFTVPGTLVNGNEFLPVTPFILPIGHYSVVAVGFSATNLNGNSTAGGTYVPSTEHTGGGAISFLTTGRYDTNTTLDFPATTAGNPFQFLAGTFQFRLLATDAFQVSYAANLDIGDSYVDITNSGSSGGNLCANVYTFDPAEELISCCTCTVTPNALQSLSVRNSLISNPLTPSIPTSVVIKIVATTAPTCNASTASLAQLGGGMLSWGTTLHSRSTTPASYGVTEKPFSVGDLSREELRHITSTCGFIQSNGSGFGICRGCAAGGLGATNAQ